MGTKRSRIHLSEAAYKKLCTEVHTRDKWQCKCCRYRHTLHAHHILFRSHGGDDARYNLITLCVDCHEAVHDRYLIILPLKEGEVIDADEGIRLMRVNGWRPKRRVR